MALKKISAAEIKACKETANSMKTHELKIGSSVLVADEKAGPMLYNKTGALKSIKEDNVASVDFSPAFGIVQVNLKYLIGAKGSKDAVFKPFKPLQPMTLLAKGIKESWLSMIEDEIFQPHADGSWLLDQHLTVAMEFLKFGLHLKPEEVSYVEPTVSKLFFQVAHEADLDDLEELQAIEALFLLE